RLARIEQRGNECGNVHGNLGKEVRVVVSASKSAIGHESGVGVDGGEDRICRERGYVHINIVKTTGLGVRGSPLLDKETWDFSTLGKCYRQEEVVGRAATVGPLGRKPAGSAT